MDNNEVSDTALQSATLATASYTHRVIGLRHLSACATVAALVLDAPVEGEQGLKSVTHGLPVPLTLLCEG